MAIQPFAAKMFLRARHLKVLNNSPVVWQPRAEANIIATNRC